MHTRTFRPAAFVGKNVKVRDVAVKSGKTRSSRALPSSYSHATVAVAPADPAETKARIATAKLSPAKVKTVFVMRPSVGEHVIPCTVPLFERLQAPEVPHPPGTVPGRPIKSW
jgi:hypothetical protein